MSLLPAVSRRCHLLKEQIDAPCSVAALYYLAVVSSSSRVAVVDEKVSYCLAGPPLLARSSCVAAMDESSNTSPKKVVYLVYIELATDGSIPFFWQTEIWLGIDRELARRGLEGIANQGVRALRFGLPRVMHLDGSILLE
jgi:hypothetical protein